MIFFRKKNTEVPQKKPKTVQAVLERVLTAHGWQQKVAKKLKKAK